MIRRFRIRHLGVTGAAIGVLMLATAVAAFAYTKSKTWTINACTFKGSYDYNRPYFEGVSSNLDAADCRSVKAAIRYWESGYGYRYKETGWMSAGGGTSTDSAAFIHYSRHRARPFQYPTTPWKYLY